MSHVGECGVSEKKRGPREGGGLQRVGDPPPHEKFSTASQSTLRTLFRLILTKMAYPHIDTKIPLRVVYPPSPTREGPPSLRVRDPSPRIIFDEPQYEWGYLRAFCSMPPGWGLSNGSNPLVWRRSRLLHGSGRGIKNHLFDHQKKISFRPPKKTPFSTTQKKNRPPKNSLFNHTQKVLFGHPKKNLAKDLSF